MLTYFGFGMGRSSSLGKAARIRAAAAASSGVGVIPSVVMRVLSRAIASVAWHRGVASERTK
jgi:hypothetical protein